VSLRSLPLVRHITQATVCVFLLFAGVSWIDDGNGKKLLANIG
jgi:hypothetical protein